MVQTITPALTDLLVSKLQAGASGFRGEIEIDWVFPAWSEADTGSLQNLAFAIGTATGYTNGAGGVPAPDNPERVNDGSTSTSSQSSNGLALGGPFTSHRGWEVDLTQACNVTFLQIAPHSGLHGPDTLEYSDDGASWTAAAYTETSNSPIFGWTRWDVDGGPVLAQYWRVTDSQFFAGPGFEYFEAFSCSELQVWGTSLEVTEHPAEVHTVVLTVESFALDRSRQMAAAQLDAALSNEDAAFGYYTQANPLVVPNNPVRAYAWYGDIANRVCVFTGLLDRIHEGRDPKDVTLKARSRMKWLIEQQFLATASQSVDDTSAVRTEDNGVYIGKSPEYIVADILDRAGWPPGDRDLGTSGVTIDEYDLADGTSWAEQIAGADRLTTTAGFDFWEDELGIVHFAANALADVSEPDPDYTFQVGVDVLRLDHETDDEDRATRVRVSGPMTSAVPSWSQEWAATFAAAGNLGHPTGAMYRASEPGYLYVVDGLTHYLCKVRQADRVIVEKWHLAGLTYDPIGLSGDPVDSTIFWVLDADWRFGATSHAKAQKVTFSTKVIANTYSLPDGDWSDLKTDGSNLWLTNFGDDKLYKRSMTATAVASYSYAGHTAPTGLYLDGTTIGLFFNGGAAFYLVDTSAPGTITGTQSTAGTHIEGGEIDSTTDVDLYAVASAGDFGNTAGYLWKFALATLVTSDVVKWAYDQDLEDSLGVQSGIADRVHDIHSGDAAHPFEIRPATYAMNVVNSEAQAQAVADAQLVLLSRLRRVMDLATLGNPAIQIDDVIRYIDPVAAIDSVWLLDSYRAQIDAAGTYTTTMSLLPWVEP